MPLTPCRRKKRKDEESESSRGAPTATVTAAATAGTTPAVAQQRYERNHDAQVQSSQVRVRGGALDFRVGPGSFSFSSTTVAFQFGVVSSRRTLETTKIPPKNPANYRRKRV